MSEVDHLVHKPALAGEVRLGCLEVHAAIGVMQQFFGWNGMERRAWMRARR